MTTAPSPPPGGTPPTPPFDPASPHHQKPKVRPLRGFPAKMGDQNVLGLADARQISEKMIFTAPAVQVILPLMNGERTLDEIAAQIGRGLTRQMLEGLVAQLDDAGLLFGPRFDALWEKVKRDFDSLPVLPPASTAAIADALAAQTLGKDASDEQRRELAPKALREALDAWIDKALEKAPDPAFDELPRGVIVPHIDYPRGWINYAAVWGRLRVADRPARVVILGTNHFGQATGVCGCDKGFQTPLGTCPLDEDIAARLRDRLGDALFHDRFDHEREHSIELQAAWIQHCLGADDAGNFCKVFGALVHDPSANGGESYDGKGVAFRPFVDALRDTIAELPGPTLVVSSADLSHVGPAFGDKQPLAGESKEAADARNRVFQHDHEMLALIRENKPDELIASMSWQQNPTRWCSIGSIAATLLVTAPAQVQVLNYAAAMDPQGMGMVSSVAAVLR